MSRELWATYSVGDHREPRGLAADILLFDRLVFPVPMTYTLGRLLDPDEPDTPKARREVVWTEDPAEWKRWECNGWEPARQKRLLRLLEPVVRRIPWDDEHQARWLEQSTKAAAAGTPDWAFQNTRLVLTSDLPKYVEGLEAIGPAYRSLDDIERDFGISRAGGRVDLPAGALATVFGWEFLAPDIEDATDEAVLKDVVAFVDGNDELRDSRARFTAWQQDFLRDGLTDRESIERALKKGRELLEQEQTVVNKLQVKKRARYAFRLIPGVITMGVGLLTGLPPVVATGGGLCVTAVGIAVDEWLFKDAEKAKEEQKPSPTAFVSAGRRHFGWE